MTPEAQVQHDILRALGALPDVTIWRNNRGHARNPKTGQHVDFGGPPGASDLLGLGPGGRLIAFEVKSATGRATPQQKAFIRMVLERGGIAGVVRSVEDALALIEQARTAAA